VKAGRPLPDSLFAESVDDVLAGAANLLRHLQIVERFGAPAVVAINAFPTDHASEHVAIEEIAARAGVRAVVTTAVADGGRGGSDLAEAVEKAASAPGQAALLYPDDLPLAEKIRTVATRVYGAEGVDFTPPAARSLERLETLGFGSLPVCMAKTHLSLSHDPTLLGAPAHWRLPVTDVRVHAGAGFVYALCGDMQTMPGLGRNPAATRIDLDDAGDIVGLF
jgi:formate--tetrahydrofolate ligase